MAVRRSTLRSSFALGIALALVATGSAVATAAPRGSTGAGTDPDRKAPAVAAKGSAAGIKLTSRPAFTRPPVNVRRLAAKKPTVREQRTLPFLSPRASTPAPKQSGGPKAVLAVPADPDEATTNTDPTAFQDSFDGLAQTTSADTNGEPPDPWVAVGPEHIVQAVNLSIRITNRQGTQSLADVALADFFQLPPAGFFNTDPHVIYDSLHGRWLATEASWDCDASGGASFGHGYIDFAVSRTIDPTGTWDQGFIVFDDVLPDFPAPGTSSDKIGLASNVFGMVAGPDCVASSSPFFGGDVIYMDWADVLDLGSLTILESFFPETDIVGSQTQHWATPRVAVQVPATSSRMHIIAQFDFGTGTTGLGYVSVLGSVRTPGSLHVERLDSLTDEYPLVSGFVDPPAPRQPGSPATIVDAVDSRPTDAIWQDGRLVIVSTAGCTPAGDSAERDCVRVTELDTSTVGTGRTTPPPSPRTSSSPRSARTATWAASGCPATERCTSPGRSSSATATDYPSLRTAHQVLGDPLSSLSAEEVLGAGTARYPGTRWGDYVGVAQDPQVPSQAWDANQYSVGASGWATKVSRLQTGGTTYVPIAPVRVLDTRDGTGLSGMFTMGTARSWQVAGFGPIPAEAVAVTGNVTVNGQQSRRLRVRHRDPDEQPGDLDDQLPGRPDRANNVTIPLSSAGKLSAVFGATSGKKTHLLFDVTGYFLADETAATFTPVTPFRALDTRNNTGLIGKFVANSARTLQITSPSGPIPTTATAITGNLTMVSPSKAGVRVGHEGPDKRSRHLDRQLPRELRPSQRRVRPVDHRRQALDRLPDHRWRAESRPPRRDRLLRARNRRPEVRPAQPVEDHGHPPERRPVRAHREAHRGYSQDPRRRRPLGRPAWRRGGDR